MKRITLEELTSLWKEETYSQVCSRVYEQIACEKLKPVMASGTNGKSPALYREYWVTAGEKESEKNTQKEKEWLEELLYQMTPAISVDYYKEHLETYEKDREWVLSLNRYLKQIPVRERKKISVNERSFAIWQREKFLQREQGIKILKRCGLCPEDLNVYETAEPFSYFTATAKTPQNLLIVENKDTFYSIRKVMSETSAQRKAFDGAEYFMPPLALEKAAERGNATKEETVRILEKPIGTLIYGAGKGIWRSFAEFSNSAEEYMMEKENQFFYFGDLDYEGILIYEKLEEEFGKAFCLKPFSEGYRRMLEKSREYPALPRMKEGQNRNLKGSFFTYFTQAEGTEMKRILEQGCYLPQEIVNGEDF